MYAPKRLYLRDLPIATCQDDIYKVFNEHGAVVEVKIIPGSNYAFVEYALPEEAQKALDVFAEGDFMGHKITVEFAHPLRKDTSSAENMSDGPRLYVGDLPEIATPTYVHKVLRTYGTITEFKMKPGTKFAFVRYASTRDSQDVMDTFREGSFLGKRILVEWAHDERHTEKLLKEAHRSRARVRVVVVNIPRYFCWQELKDFGRLSGRTVAYCEMQKPNDGRGFLEFHTKQDAEVAVQELDGWKVGKTKVSVFIADTQYPRSSLSSDDASNRSSPSLKDISNAATTKLSSHSRRSRSRSPERLSYPTRYEPIKPNWVPLTSPNLRRKDNETNYSPLHYRRFRDYDYHSRDQRLRVRHGYHEYERQYHYNRYEENTYGLPEDYYKRYLELSDFPYGRYY